MLKWSILNFISKSYSDQVKTESEPRPIYIHQLTGNYIDDYKESVSDVNIYRETKWESFNSGKYWKLIKRWKFFACLETWI